MRTLWNKSFKFSGLALKISCWRCTAYDCVLVPKAASYQLFNKRIFLFYAIDLIRDVAVS